MMKGKVIPLAVVLALSLVLVAVALAASCSSRPGYSRSTFSSNGEKIYFTARNDSGETVKYSGGPFSLFGRYTCADCHDGDGKGNRAGDVPEITWQALTRAEHSGTNWQADTRSQLSRHLLFGNVAYAHSEHEPYTEETLKHAITEGIRPHGEKLNGRMPRWRLSQADLDDLVAFMKTL